MENLESLIKRKLTYLLVVYLEISRLRVFDTLEPGSSHASKVGTHHLRHLLSYLLEDPPPALTRDAHVFNPSIFLRLRSNQLLAPAPALHRLRFYLMHLCLPCFHQPALTKKKKFRFDGFMSGIGKVNEATKTLRCGRCD